ncbi:MAG: type II toxin-antitoxin system VapC family toxin [SAR202 cluster bacterium]|nr:type II toxin-antitoxin system VapC family toxin [SAR202 cluster bacterium]
MPGKVVDASIFAAIAFEEPSAVQAKTLLEGVDEFFEPHLLAYELCNVAKKKILADIYRYQSIASQLSFALAMKIHWVPVDHSEVLDIALQTKLSIYDASYLYLSKKLGAPLVTFDDKLRTAADKYLGPGGTPN